MIMINLFRKKGPDYFPSSLGLVTLIWMKGKQDDCTMIKVYKAMSFTDHSTCKNQEQMLGLLKIISRWHCYHKEFCKFLILTIMRTQWIHFQAWYFILEGARQFFLGKGHLYEEFVIFYWNISKGTKANTRGNGGNCLRCLREASDLNHLTSYNLYLSTFLIKRWIHGSGLLLARLGCWWSRITKKKCT